MLEKTFFCIRPYIFEKKELIKQIITDSGLVIKDTKIVWLTRKDVRVIYGHEEPSVYFDACMEFMTRGFVETGIIEGENVIAKLVELASDTHIPREAKIHTLRAIFGKTEPINFNGLDYYLNPLHRSRNKDEAEKETTLFNELKLRQPIQIIQIMMQKLHKDKNLIGVYNHHIKLVVKIGLELANELGGDKIVVELACWLHDIASLDTGDKHEHHIAGAEKAEKILQLLGYNKSTIINVKHCIETHRGSCPLQRMTPEADIVCNADGIANLKYAPLLYYFAYGRHQLNFEDGLKKIRNKIESSWSKLTDYAKIKAKEDYDKWQKLFS